MHESIALSTPRVSGNRLEVRISASKGVAKYLRGNMFRCEYSGATLSDIPEGILAIPAVGSLATMAWALGTGPERAAVVRPERLHV